MQNTVSLPFSDAESISIYNQHSFTPQTLLQCFRVEPTFPYLRDRKGDATHPGVDRLRVYRAAQPGRAGEQLQTGADGLQGEILRSALGRFISPDSITPGGPEGLNRYAYVNNSPINANDPTGHMADECGGFDCGGDNGNSDQNSDDESTNPSGLELADCWSEHPCMSDRITPPPIATLHPLDGNVVYKKPIYDNSYYPPLLIGYSITSYATYDVDFDPLSYLPIPRDSFSTATLGYEIAKKILKPGLENLASVGIVFTCPECSVAVKILSLVHDTNEAFTFDAYLRTHDVYFHSYSDPYMASPYTQFPTLEIRR
jgi:RHS repeat-associated protein